MNEVETYNGSLNNSNVSSCVSLIDFSIDNSLKSYYKITAIFSNIILAFALIIISFFSIER